MNLIKEYFNCCADNLKKDIDNNINKTIEITEKITEGKIDKIIKTRNLQYLYKNYEPMINSNYNKKEEIGKLPLEKYKEEINEFIIKPIFYSRNNYALIEIYEIVINTILTPLFKKYNDLLQESKKEMKDSIKSIFESNYQNFVKNSNLNEYDKIK